MTSRGEGVETHFLPAASLWHVASTEKFVQGAMSEMGTR